jgi:hypothetical protein
MHIISTITILALLGVAVGIIGNMLMTHRHAIISALKAEPTSDLAFQPVCKIIASQAAVANGPRVQLVGASRSERPELLALAA